MSRSAVIGLVIGLLAGVVLVALALVGVRAILRRRNASYQVCPWHITSLRLF